MMSRFGGGGWQASTPDVGIIVLGLQGRREPWAYATILRDLMFEEGIKVERPVELGVARQFGGLCGCATCSPSHPLSTCDAGADDRVRESWCALPSLYVDGGDGTLGQFNSAWGEGDAGDQMLARRWAEVEAGGVGRLGVAEEPYFWWKGAAGLQPTRSPALWAQHRQRSEERGRRASRWSDDGSMMRWSQGNSPGSGGQGMALACKTLASFVGRDTSFRKGYGSLRVLAACLGFRGDEGVWDNLYRAICRDKGRNPDEGLSRDEALGLIGARQGVWCVPGEEVEYVLGEVEWAASQVDHGSLPFGAKPGDVGNGMGVLLVHVASTWWPTCAIWAAPRWNAGKGGEEAASSSGGHHP